MSDNFITCNLQGRLGNQIFIISATIGTAIKYGKEFKIPRISKYPHFNKTYFNHLPELTNPYTSTYIESTHAYQEIPNIDGLCLEGYFQTEKYFSHCRLEILKAFSHLLSNETKSDVAIHVRRGDYIDQQKNFPLCPMEYYCKAIMYFIYKEQVNFTVFSDDIQWCKENINQSNFPLGNFEYSEGRDEMSDLKYMSQHEHFIIANSSYSWWGAWLSKNENKTVIAPNIWFGTNLAHLDTKDLIPETWMKM